MNKEEIEREFEPNWEAILTTKETDFRMGIAYLLKMVDFSFSESIYNKLDDRGKKYFKLKL